MRTDELRWIHDVGAPRWRTWTVAALRAAGLAADRLDAAGLAVHEAVCNAHEHGHRGDAGHGVGLRLEHGAPDRLEVHVVDRALAGPWSPPVPARSGGDAAVPDPTERGHGLELMRAGCDGLSIVSGPAGTRVVLRFDIRP